MAKNWDSKDEVVIKDEVVTKDEVVEAPKETPKAATSSTESRQFNSRSEAREYAEQVGGKVTLTIVAGANVWVV